MSVYLFECFFNILIKIILVLLNVIILRLTGKVLLVEKHSFKGHCSPTVSLTLTSEDAGRTAQI